MKDFWTEFRHVGNTTAARRGWQHAAEFLLCANPDHGQTLGELQRSTPWVWLWCERCQHHAPLACAVPVIRWGPNASSDKLRARTPSSAARLAPAILASVVSDLRAELQLRARNP